jgi:hypothetical protein
MNHENMYGWKVTKIQYKFLWKIKRTNFSTLKQGQDLYVMVTYKLVNTILQIQHSRINFFPPKQYKNSSHCTSLQSCNIKTDL